MPKDDDDALGLAFVARDLENDYFCIALYNTRALHIIYNLNATIDLHMHFFLFIDCFIAFPLRVGAYYRWLTGIFRLSRVWSR